MTINLNENYIAKLTHTHIELGQATLSLGTEKREFHNAMAV